MEEEGRKERRKSPDALVGTSAQPAERKERPAHSYFLCSCSHPDGTKNSRNKMGLWGQRPKRKLIKKPLACDIHFELQHMDS